MSGASRPLRSRHDFRPAPTEMGETLEEMLLFSVDRAGAPAQDGLGTVGDRATAARREGRT